MTSTERKIYDSLSPSMGRYELVQTAKQLGVTIRSNERKSEIIRAIKSYLDSDAAWEAIIHGKEF